MKTPYPTLLLFCFLTACSQDPLPEPGNSAVDSQDTVKIEAVLNTPSPLDEVENIAEAKATAKKGDTLTLQGKIMGSPHPFVGGRAAFTMGDPEVLISCDLMEGDTCETPWDNCCDDPKLIQAQTVLVQIVDDQGIVLRAPIKGVQGIAELSELRVTGIVESDPSNGVLILNATAMDIL